MITQGLPRLSTILAPVILTVILWPSCEEGIKANRDYMVESRLDPMKSASRYYILTTIKTMFLQHFMPVT